MKRQNPGDVHYDSIQIEYIEQKEDTIGGKEKWLAIAERAIGLAWNPFEHLEASADKRLSQNMVRVGLPPGIARDNTVLVTAPPGGGKTALRIYVAQDCWSRIGVSHPLPVPVVPDQPEILSATTSEEGYRFLLTAVARSLLIGLAHRPQRFLDLDNAGKRFLASVWNALLPSPLARYRRILSTGGGSPRDLADILDRTYRIEGESAPIIIERFCRELEAAERRDMGLQDKYHDLFTQMVELVTHSMEFTNIYLLFDGVDAFPHEDVTAAAEWCRRAYKWSAEYQNIYPKFFLPDDIGNRFLGFVNEQQETLTVLPLTWDEQRLVEIIRTRLEVASDGRVRSLDTIAEPTLSDVERKLVEPLPRLLPREALVMAETLLVKYAKRTGGKAPLSTLDIDAAHRTYFANPAVHSGGLA
jgi:hypothetical protein